MTFFTWNILKLDILESSRPSCGIIFYGCMCFVVKILRKWHTEYSYELHEMIYELGKCKSRTLIWLTGPFLKVCFQRKEACECVRIEPNLQSVCAQRSCECVRRISVWEGWFGTFFSNSGSVYLQRCRSHHSSISGILALPWLSWCLAHKTNGQHIT